MPVEVNKVFFAHVVNFESQQFPQNIIRVTTAITLQLQSTSFLYKTSITSCLPPTPDPPNKVIWLTYNAKLPL